ncbi:hypothetical protein A2331_00995 [Candidatus Falkowbacteria bacterium RIFOXYB2_FULL_34_18]|uniref:Uncharacterized protein n=1 Tax=Candidatus Falkowbacteria bacterium RIFOXYD2_FULL_34_120 TaxID=1798007 RepID=A0A1F5TSI3_9BACT|nr:MAG: hypothetical protein A2331_00995 [Candidatus Falkowbacteria bacterium RIFOXYB2_FULL_34_18]OGF30177.1 MAG: hypothetical protein A2500_02115 [Candidatus Falkowbacteria bacterium RIFOXYC12_FULL_34_55]OGF37674.1 MAG: hypothetical protein A2466_05550 [Candidatus Falkowbacteria bacterium RIFOXYC2_FULL_34_220]OGF39401.1 MAG: hypothetical protein A2515_02780 [Candidatus Falkowbacteria bacterium RIFOXYD12_FULL_34_57]OGF41930.1 MAG: hypothetical protein A2531_04845 [Candidatus Falkowbacteria bact
MKFRLQFWSSAELGILSRKDVEKYCFIHAIQEETDINKLNEENFQNNEYTEAMTLQEIQLFIKKDPEKYIGRDAQKCIGVCLEECYGELITFE